MHRLLFSLALSLLLAQPGLAADDATSTREINYLLEFVASSGCTFIRNGDDHASPAAADHLRLKYNRGKRYVNSPEQFIDRLASESSWSGDPYTVNCQGTTQASAQWLYRALADYRQAGAPSNAPGTP
jgi:hypothetical protein